ncbi:hypothetical protein Dimus_004357 [Dionaea muscipula]
MEKRKTGEGDPPDAPVCGWLLQCYFLTHYSAAQSVYSTAAAASELESQDLGLSEMRNGFNGRRGDLRWMETHLSSPTTDSGQRRLPDLLGVPRRSSGPGCTTAPAREAAGTGSGGSLSPGGDLARTALARIAPARTAPARWSSITPTTGSEIALAGGDLAGLLLPGTAPARRSSITPTTGSGDGSCPEVILPGTAPARDCSCPGLLLVGTRPWLTG